MGARKVSSKELSEKNDSTRRHERAILASQEHARKTYVESFKESSVADNIDAFPKFDKGQLKLGKVLGTGAFGTVHEVRGVKVDNERNSDEGQFIADHCLRENTGDARYAIKELNEELFTDYGMLIRGTLDFAIETRVLSDIEHPNIIKARALASGSVFDEGYFIMMDRLYDTLQSRIGKWAKKKKNLSGLGGKILDKHGKKKKKLLKERLVAAFDLSDALGYLHRKKIVYRDLKPDNIGFDIRDDVKLFDFGLAIEMHNGRKAVDDLYNFTGMTGSPRYMSPEVANEDQYNEKCDVYSFAVLFWQMLALKTPFEVYTMSKLKERVWNGEQKRPFIDPDWPEPMKNLLERSWNKEIKTRPSFQEITRILRHQCVQVHGGNVEGLNHSRRRSTFVFTKNICETT
mmetsp:Transcript_16661/g.38457  ORF Transcript_16661/g.38457 Transcript_16661/m.38457 type:complete len:403 (+) Transcript_16661:120-1328(+)